MKDILTIVFIIALKSVAAQSTEDDLWIYAAKNVDGCKWHQSGSRGGSVERCYDENHHLKSVEILRIRRSIFKKTLRFHRRAREYNEDGKLIYRCRSRPWGVGGAVNIVTKCTYHESGTIKQLTKTKEHVACRAGYTDYNYVKNFDSDGKKIKND